MEIVLRVESAGCHRWLLVMYCKLLFFKVQLYKGVSCFSISFSLPVLSSRLYSYLSFSVRILVLQWPPSDLTLNIHSFPSYVCHSTMMENHHSPWPLPLSNDRTTGKLIPAPLIVNLSLRYDSSERNRRNRFWVALKDDLDTCVQWCLEWLSSMCSIDMSEVYMSVHEGFHEWLCLTTRVISPVGSAQDSTLPHRWMQSLCR